MIILDTNFILTCIKQKINLFGQLRENFSEYYVVIPSVVVAELEKLKEDRKLKLAERNAAGLALQLIEKENVKIIKLEGEADDAIVNYALNNKSVVGSLDNGLRKRVKGRAGFLTIKRKKLIALI